MIKYFSLYKIPTAPLVLGLGGTLPFILLPLIIWTGSNEIKLMALYNLINYSIIILSFIGAIHWGASMIREDISFKWYLISISPAILSFLPPTFRTITFVENNLLSLLNRFLSAIFYLLIN